MLSWLVAGFGCALTACAYAELSTLVKSSGSTYAFAYHGLGEVYGVVGAMLVSLEYVFSSAAVARAWVSHWNINSVSCNCSLLFQGDKVGFWLGANSLLGMNQPAFLL